MARRLLCTLRHSRAYPMSAPRRHVDTQIFWQRQVDAWHESGLNKAAFCRQAGVQPASFGQWSRRLSLSPSRSSQGAPSTLSAMAMIPVSVMDEVMAIEGVVPSQNVIVERADISLTLPATLCAEHINTWLTSLTSLDVQH